MNRKSATLNIAGVIFFVISAGAGATDVTRATIDAWLAESAVTEAPAAGTVIHIDDIERLRPFIPPGYFDEFQFPEVIVEIQKTMSYPGDDSYREATERFAGQATVTADGVLEGYVAGRPFSAEQIGAAAPEVAGYMVAWNQYYRWQYTGYSVDELTMYYLSQPGNGSAGIPAEGIEGGGRIDRALTQKYHRVYLSNLAMLPTQDYQVQIPDSDTVFFKDYIEFLDPFNVKGTRFVVERSRNLHEEDQVNSYLPTERRVRRLSAKERADSFMGSNGTLDDFDGFSGRVLDYKWTYLGKKRVLDVNDSKHAVLRFVGPHSRFPDDRWQLRNCHVVELRSTWEGHPYRSRVLLVDDETFDVAVGLVFNHDNVLWKTLDPIYMAALPAGHPGASIETSVSSWRGQVNIDRIATTTTVVRAGTATLHPTMSESQIKRVFSVSNLTSGQ